MTDTPTIETDTEERSDFVALATKLEEEHEERKAWMKSIAANLTSVNDAPEPLMAMKEVKWPDGVEETEIGRQNYVKQVEHDANQMLVKASTFRTIAGFEPLVRDTDALFETPEYTSLAKFRDAADSYQEEMVKAALGAGYLPRADQAWDSLFDQVKETNDGRYSPEALKNLIRENTGKSIPGQDMYGVEWKATDALTGTPVRSPQTDAVGLKALLNATTSGVGIQPYPAQLDIIIERALARPTVFRIMPGQSITEKSYQFRQETANTEQVGYFNETGTSRTDTSNMVDTTISATTKTLLTAISYSFWTYEQVYTEPIARQFFRRRLEGALERWIDKELVTGTGGSGKIETFNTITKDSDTATTAGNFSSGAGGNNNRYVKASSGQSDLQAMFRAMVHMEDEDKGNSVPGFWVMTPVGYEMMVNNEIGSADARWLFPGVLASNSPVTPFGMTVLKNDGPADTEVYLVDPQHLLFRTHAQGITLETDKHPRRLEEELIIHTLFQFDVWRNHAIQRVTGLFS